MATQHKPTHRNEWLTQAGLPKTRGLSGGRVAKRHDALHSLARFAQHKVFYITRLELRADHKLNMFWGEKPETKQSHRPDLLYVRPQKVQTI